MQKNTLISLYIEAFMGKMGIIHNNLWLERKDTISRGRYGISSTDAIKESFCSSLQKIDKDRFIDFLMAMMKLEHITRGGYPIIWEMVETHAMRNGKRVLLWEEKVLLKR